MADDNRKPIKNTYTVLKSGQKIEIILTKDQEELVYQSKIVRVEDDDFFTTPPLRDEEEISLRPNQEVMMSFRGIDALYEFRAKIVNIVKLKSGTRQFRFTLPDKAWRTQRRNFFRVPFMSEGRLRQVREEKVGPSHTLTPFGGWEQCYFVNMSGGGIAFLTNTYIPINGYIQVEFKIPSGTYQEIIKIVRVRIVENKVGPNTYGYASGGYFFSMDDKIRDEIIHFIYQKQLEMQRKFHS